MECLLPQRGRKRFAPQMMTKEVREQEQRRQPRLVTPLRSGIVPWVAIVLVLSVVLETFEERLIHLYKVRLATIDDPKNVASPSCLLLALDPAFTPLCCAFAFYPKHIHESQKDTQWLSVKM